jgi:hypothetical protein
MDKDAFLIDLSESDRTDFGRVDFSEQSEAQQVLIEFEAATPNLWDELTSNDPDELIAELTAYRELHHRNDRRYLVVCGMRGDDVHVAWT